MGTELCSAWKLGLVSADLERENEMTQQTTAEHETVLDHPEEFKRDMGFWGNLALGFTYLSPVVGVYTTLAASIAIVGPPAFWMILVAGFGQLMVSLVFGEVVSQYPIAGGVYPWNRRLWGPKWGWFSGWVYAIAISATIASVAYGAGPFLGAFFDIEMDAVANVIIALVIIALATLINFGGTRLLANVAFFGFVAEIIATIVIGTWLLIGGRKHDLSVLVTDFRPEAFQDNTPFIIALGFASIVGIYLFYGFEACGDVAEEVNNPGKVVPRAMRMTIYVGGVASAFIAIGLILAVPDFTAVIDGTATDPIGELFVSVFGVTGFKVVLAVVLISFLSCLISLQAAASRLLYSMGRDSQLPGSHLLKQFNARRAVPPYALLASGAFPALVVIVSLLSEDALIAIISFSSFGVYCAFSMVVIASIRARMRGWQPKGQFKLGKWGWIVSFAALSWQVFGMFIVLQPGEGPWYQAWLVGLSSLVVLGVGLIYMVVAKPYNRAKSMAGDAATGVVDTRAIDPIAPSEEIVDLAVRLDGGKPNLYEDRRPQQ